MVKQVKRPHKPPAVLQAQQLNHQAHGNQALKYGLLALSVVAVSVAVYYATQKSEVPKLATRVIELTPEDAPIKSFPQHFSRMVSPGMMASASARQYCKIELNYPEPSDCDYLSKVLQESARNQMDPMEYASIVKKASSSVEPGFRDCL